MKEFDIIAQYFAPLAKGFDGALGLADDAALFPLGGDTALVMTKDAISEGVHFLGHEDAGLIAKKLLRTNLSDLAAMGAAPAFYFLALMLPEGTDEAWIAAFAKGLEEDQALFDIMLAGGDTITTGGPFSASMTAMGTVEKNRALLRRNAKVGDRIYVSGTLGDSALGLALLQDQLEVMALVDALWLKERYFLPQPRIALGQKLGGIAHACMDISDGLVQDLAHICAASKVAAVVRRRMLPLSDAVRKIVDAQPHWWKAPLSGGDDYELLFTASPAAHSDIMAIGRELNVPIAVIGDIVAGEGVAVLDDHGSNVTPAHKGYSHL